jgi:hypothetical protein
MKPSSSTTNPRTGDQDDNSAERMPWDSDTHDKEYIGSSEATLLDWLKTPGNYAHWRGNAQGVTKKEIQQKIADRLNKDGIEKHGGINRGRDQKKVGNKIDRIEIKFLAALSFMEQTGQGIKEEKGLSEDQFKDLVSDRFRHFWDLYDIMKDRSKMTPVFVSDNLDNDFDNNAAGYETMEKEEDVREELQDDPLVTNGDHDNDSNNDDSCADVADDVDDDNSADANSADADAVRTAIASPVKTVYVPSTSSESESDMNPSTPAAAATAAAPSSAANIRRTPLASSSRSTPQLKGTSSTKSKKKKTFSTGSLASASTRGRGTNDDILAFLASKLDSDDEDSDRGNRKRAADPNMTEEVKRHNKVMEDIERQRLAREEAAAVLEAARSSSNFQLELYNQYLNLPKELSLVQIAEMFPQYIYFFDASKLTEERCTHLGKSMMKTHGRLYNSSISDCREHTQPIHLHSI